MMLTARTSRHSLLPIARAGLAAMQQLTPPRSQFPPRHARSLYPVPFLVLAITYFCSFLAPVASAQTEYRLDGANWTIAVPKGWVVAPPAALKAVNDVAQSMVARAGGQPPVYVLQLIPEVPNGRYVLIQRQGAPPASLTFAELERLNRTQFEAQSEAISKRLGMTSKPPAFDSDPMRHRLIISSEMQAGGTSLGYLSVSAFAHDAHLIVHAYAPAGDFDSALPELRAIADSLRFDQGAEFVFAGESATSPNTPPTPNAPSPGASSSAPTTSRVVNALLNGATVVSAAAVVTLVIWLLKRRKAV